ncbi:bifunctional DNA primase/polymerase [Bacillus altitudinis]|uniref:bifunctional DNA primase/polymerase n=1 Tax=Bacillus altitudinis TaxID=293387 RepID=UPI003CEE01C6
MIIKSSIHKNPVLEAALGYSELLNWAVIPLHSVVNGRCTCNRNCQSPGKHPRTSNGLKAATTDRNTIIGWFTENPISNIGIVTGKKSGFIVVDIDRKHQGFESLNYLMEVNGKFPSTVEAISGGGGYHYLFKYTSHVRNKTNLLPGIDIRGDGGYVVVAPSVHSSGKRYEWELSSKPYVNEIAEPPEWLTGMLTESKEGCLKVKPSGYWESIMKGVIEGERNNKAASLAGHLLRRDVDVLLVVEIMKIWNQTRVEPPLKSSELETTIDSIARLERERRERERG